VIRGLLPALLGSAALAAPAVAQAAPEIWAHRGGSYIGGRAVHPENTLPAFEAAARRGFVLELDVHLSRDGVLFVIHDDTLDRTTRCTGRVQERTYADIRDHCRSDVVGSPGGPLGARSRHTAPRVPLPTFAEVLRIARRERVTIAPELKEFDPTGASARALAHAVRASGIPLRHVVVQSFFPPNLAAVREALPGVRTSQLTLAAGNDGGIDLASSGHATWVSPEFPVSAAYVALAHGRGLKVVPYTIDTPRGVRAAAAAGVDALITDDPVMARRALRRGTRRPAAARR
jgi:glycerophosphoryl diester phosphodiesterase